MRGLLVFVVVFFGLFGLWQFYSNCVVGGVCL